MEHHAKKAMEHSEVYVAGKSSVGTRTEPENYHLSVPEFNRIELIERADALIINRFTLLPFQQLCDMVKRSKHFLAVTYPELTIDECTHLAKLIDEAQTVVQFSNPFSYLPAVRWLNRNLKKPAFIEVFCFEKESFGTNKKLQLLLMLADVTRSKPKKIRAVAYRSEPAGGDYTNLQLEYDNGLVVSFHTGKNEQVQEFKIKSYAFDQFTEINLTKGSSHCNHQTIDLSPFKKGDETDAFIQAVLKKNINTTGINEYLLALQTLRQIESRLEV